MTRGATAAASGYATYLVGFSTLVDTDSGLAALTHLWLFEGAPVSNLDVDPALVEEHRARVLEAATIIVPGHGPMYRV